jgi:hypothetical protein
VEAFSRGAAEDRAIKLATERRREERKRIVMGGRLEGSWKGFYACLRMRRMKNFSTGIEG